MGDFKSVYGNEIVSVEGRFVFPKFNEPDTGHKYSRGTYNTTFLVPKETVDTPEFEEMMQALCEVAGVDDVDDLEKHPFIVDGKLKDGDEGENAERPGFPGNIFMKAGTKQQPDCFTEIDVDEPEEIDPSNIKSGDWGRMILTPCCYEEGETTFYIQAVLLTRVGERLAGGGKTVDSKSMFATALSTGAKTKKGKGKAKKKNGSLTGMLD